ncbi:hypothetical protein JL721_5318 [Aureococcus anophagefferens]|nr:hypothetical protein JL721_5318 [Aureococcus anophagefferens]
MLQKLLQPFARPARPTQVSLGESRGAEGKEPELSDEERRCEIVETFLRRDAHGGFGLFFASGGGAAVVRKVSGMWDTRVSDGRRLLAPGDTVVRVGGFPRRRPATCAARWRPRRPWSRSPRGVRRRCGAASAAPTASAAERKRSGPVAMEDSAAVEEEARTLKVPVDRLSWLAEPERPRETKGGESELRAGLRGLAEGLIEKPKEPKPSDDLDVIASAAERTLAPPPSKIFKEGLEFSAVGACVDINRRFGTSRPNFEILSLGQFEVGAAMARELDRVGETAKTFQRGLEADESDDGGEQRSYGAAALELAAAAGSFATAARVVLRPEFRADVVRAAEPGGQAAKRPINVAALLAPGLLLVSRHLLPFADALRKSPLHARRRDGARCLADVEARAKHASHLAELALTLTDEDARELSEQDLEQTLGAFAPLRTRRRAGADAAAAVPRARARLRGGAAPAGEEAASHEAAAVDVTVDFCDTPSGGGLAGTRSSREPPHGGHPRRHRRRGRIRGALDAACGGDERGGRARRRREACARRRPARELQDVLVERETSLAKQALDMARVTVPHAGDLTALAASASGGSRRRRCGARAAAPAAGRRRRRAAAARDAAPPPPEGPSASDEAALLQKLDMAAAAGGASASRPRSCRSSTWPAAVVTAAGRGGSPPPPPPDGAAPPPDGARRRRGRGEGGFGDYFDLATESLRAKSALLRKQIADRERIIDALDAASAGWNFAGRRATRGGGAASATSRGAASRSASRTWGARGARWRGAP